jgi:hypothetical protein
MSEAANKFPIIREAVASLPDRAHFRQAVARLLADGFDRSDISVLASHAPIEAADDKSPSLIAAGLTDEVNYIAPLTVAGIILVSGGPIAATLAALVAAGLGGAALKELFDFYAAASHRDDVEAALKAGAALIWVRCADPELELRATRILEEAAARPCPRPQRSAGQRRLISVVDRRASSGHGTGRATAFTHQTARPCR